MLTSGPDLTARSPMTAWKALCQRLASSSLWKAKVTLSVSLMMCFPLWSLNENCTQSKLNCLLACSRCVPYEECIICRLRCCKSEKMS